MSNLLSAFVKARWRFKHWDQAKIHKFQERQARKIVQYAVTKSKFYQSHYSNKNLDDVIDIHLSVIETYQDDFAKYARYSQLSKIQNVFHYVPQAIGNKVKYSNIDPNSQARDIKAAIDTLR